MVRRQKMALLVLRRVGLCVGQNQMCHLCGWLKLFLKNVRWKKIKIQKRWLLGRLSDGSFVPSLYVYFCRSFLLCRLLGLQVTGCSLAKWRKSKHKCSVLYKSSIEELPLNLALNPPFCQTAVLVAQHKYTKNLYKNEIFRKLMHARKEEFYATIICFG